MAHALLMEELRGLQTGLTKISDQTCYPFDLSEFNLSSLKRSILRNWPCGSAQKNGGQSLGGLSASFHQA